MIIYYQRYNVWGKYYQYQYEQLLPLMFEISEEFSEKFELQKTVKRKKFF